MVFSIDTNRINMPGKPIQDPQKLIKDFTSFWLYFTRYINFEDEFIAMDSTFNKIGKLFFLKELTTGNYFPVRLYSKDNIYYQLYKPSTWPVKDISSTIKHLANTSLMHYKMEGKLLPEFSFVDIYGNDFNSNSLKEKYLVIKFWFINCIKCIEEFPDLNNLVNKNSKNNDIIFLSLALDSDPKLIEFLKNRQFKYKVVGNQSSYIEKLGINEYPTHILVNKNGIIYKVLGSYTSLEKYLNKLIND